MTAQLDLARLLGPADQTMALPVSFDIPMMLQQNGRARPIVLRSSAREPHRDAELIALLADARRWRDEMLGGQVPSIDAITRRERLAKGMISRILPLAWLAPDITAAILDGLQPPAITAKRLREIPDLPLAWSEQRALLGFPAV